MPATTCTFRVFVSSTFHDLKEERNALARPKGPFKALAELCQSHGARFQAIDLRWGVREEAGLDQKAIEICMAEIERCQRTGIKPNFIVLLGDRYGWRPLPARIDGHEFQTVRRQIDAEADLMLVENWYRRDDNAVPPEYLLKPRTSEFVDPERWRVLETHLHGLLCEAARGAGLAPEALAKYEASATHQEILKGLGTNPVEREHVFAFLRNANETVTDADLQHLKEHLCTQLGDNVSFYAAGDFRKLCADVEKGLKAVILKQLAAFASRPALELEIEAHESFAKDRARHFRGRKSVLDAIAHYISGTSRQPLVLHGASGSGKSAIMARASDLVAKAMPNAVVVRRFIGASPNSSNGLTLLQSVCQEIARRYDRSGDVPATFNEVVAAFSERLAFATAERPLVLAIDALDQLARNDPAASLAWLPSPLPPHCRAVVSIIEHLPALKNGQLVEVHAFPLADAEQALSVWLQEAKRTLTSEQRRKVLDSFGRSGLPLYLKLAFEESRRWRSFDQPEYCVIPDGVEGIIDVLLDRLSRETNHGSPLVSRSLGYLTASRYGLTEDEILDVLTEDDAVWEDFRNRSKHDPGSRRIPAIVWARLFLDLEPYLMERAVPGGTVVSFCHRQLSERIRYLHGTDDTFWHLKLAQYFDSIGRGPRTVAELPWQFAQAKEFVRLHDLLLDLNFFPQMIRQAPNDFFTCWATIESETPWSIGQSYDGALPKFFNPDEGAVPRRLPVSDLMGLGDMLIQVGCPLSARRIFATLARFLRTKEEPEYLAGALVGLVHTVEPDPQGRSTDELDVAVEWLQEAEQLFRASGNARAIAECRLILAQLYRSVRRHGEARQLIAESESSAHESDQAVASLEKSLLLYDEGRYQEALELLEQGRTLYLNEGDKHGLQICVGNIARVLRRLGDLPAALAALKEQEQICREHGFAQELTNSLWGQAFTIAEEEHDPLAAHPVLSSAIHLAREHGLDKMKEHLEGYRRGQFVRLLGKQAERLMRDENLQAVTDIHGLVAMISKENGNWEDLASALANGALVLGRYMGRQEEARALMAEARSIAREHGLQDLVGTLQTLEREF